MTDKNLTCRDCGAAFIFTDSEQEFFAQKGFQNEPSRCPTCREARKADRGDRPGSYSSGGYSRERQMFPAVCAQCGQNTQVPFEPRGDRPVYCSDCYSKQPRTSSSGGSGGGGYRSGGSSYGGGGGRRY